MKIIDGRNDPRCAEAIIARRWRMTVEIENRTTEIVAAVRREGDEAVTTFTRQFDCRFIDSLGLRVSAREQAAAYKSVSRKFLKALQLARKNITLFHQQQRPKSWVMKDKGLQLECRVSPLSRVGIVALGGKFACPSRVLTNAVPASIAGVKELVLVVQSNEEGKIAAETLVAAAECGVTEIYRIGGAQAVAALAFGTESIRRVDKIVGSGNAYVTAAKKAVFGEVGIDTICEPAEVVIVADEAANPAIIAADILALAERGETVFPVFLTSSSVLAQHVELELNIQVERIERRVTAQRVLDQHGTIVIVESARHAIDIVNKLTPASLVLMVKNGERISARVKNTGAIFIGEWSSYVMGDYLTGTNDSFPTAGSARFGSPIGVADFTKRTQVVNISKKRFQKLSMHAEVLADAEGLQGGVASLQRRANT
ncbi:MAG: histidinol dehydrogenase [Bacteroidota bacterium]